MRLDVVLPTYNCHALLRRALQSLLEAPVPEGMSVGVTVVDNNSTDATPGVVNEFLPAFGGRLQYVLETTRGKGVALNAGIRRTEGELIGMIDHDEEIHPQWFTCIHRAFQDPALDFTGGPYVPRWSQPPPAWLPRRFRAVVGAIDHGPEVRRFGEPGFDALLAGGNAVVRRSLFDRVGLYSPALGPGAAGFCEDDDMHRRFMAAGACGKYLPDLIVYHWVPAERLTKSYHRKWAFRNGGALAVLDAMHPESGPRLFGAPRWFVRRGLGGLAEWLISPLLRGERFLDGFSGQLTFIRLLGFLYALHRGGMARRTEHVE